MKVDIYSDVACPWCYIGQSRFDRALAQLDHSESVEVRYHPYQLDPGAPMRAEPMLDYLARRFGGQAREMANRVIEIGRTEALEMDYDRGLAVNSLNAHRLLALAERTHGAAMQRAVMRRLFAAHFSEGRDVGDAAVLAELAGEVGMDADAVREHLLSDAGTQEVREAIDAARTLGVSAVPTYVIDDRFVVEGAQPAELFVRALEMVGQEKPAQK